MKNLWQRVREFMWMTAVIVLCLAVVPSAQANTASTTTAAQSADAKAAAGEGKPQKAKLKTTKPASKSVLDTEVLDSPIAYFKNAFSSEEDETDVTPSTGAVMVTVKALVATLLSTIL